MRLLPLLIALLALAACAAPAPAPGSQNPAEEASAAASAPDAQPVGTGGNLPPERVREDGASDGATAVVIDTSCRTDADCTVKNVGNCCGYYPACVNINSPTDPKGVQEKCMKEGLVSVCGFPAITACHCERGTCQAQGGGVVQ